MNVETREICDMFDLSNNRDRDIAKSSSSVLLQQCDIFIFISTPFYRTYNRYGKRFVCTWSTSFAVYAVSLVVLVWLPWLSPAGVNIFLHGFVPMENIRFVSVLSVTKTFGKFSLTVNEGHFNDSKIFRANWRRPGTAKKVTLNCQIYKSLITVEDFTQISKSFAAFVTQFIVDVVKPMKIQEIMDKISVGDNKSPEKIWYDTEGEAHISTSFFGCSLKFFTYAAKMST
uniref:Uncharacterized protein n=1 Tax=Glossina austeni TaxID=7395 RepID=A0A1A9VX62_GLOAU